MKKIGKQASPPYPMPLLARITAYFKASMKRLDKNTARIIHPTPPTHNRHHKGRHRHQYGTEPGCFGTRHQLSKPPSGGPVHTSRVMVFIPAPLTFACPNRKWDGIAEGENDVELGLCPKDHTRL